ncbi:kinase-like domain-containing protein, partial [Leptodontidium sp. 2 PMI_412]
MNLPSFLQLSLALSKLIFDIRMETQLSIPEMRPIFPGSRTAYQARQIYDRLGPHPYITKLLCTHKGMIVLERLQYPPRRRLLDIREQKQLPVARDVVRWARQTAQALQHIHSCGVMQVDIGPYNILLDWDENAKLSDFAGSSIDAMPTTNPSIQSELFALGSTLYEMETIYKPYPDKNDGELAKLFKANKFPDTQVLMLGNVITNCWMARYEDASQVQTKVRTRSRFHRGGKAA